MTVLAHELKHRPGNSSTRRLPALTTTAGVIFGEYEYAAVPRVAAARAHRHGRRPQPATIRVRFHQRAAVPQMPGRAMAQGGLPGSRYPQRTLLSFLDTAGEDLRSLQSTEKNVPDLKPAGRHLAAARPAADARGPRAGGPRIPAADAGRSRGRAATVLEIITDVLLAPYTDKKGQRIDKPLAIVFTKMDTLLQSLKETSPLLRSPPRNRYFDEADSLAVHAEIQRLLARWEGSRIDHIARLNYRTYRYFGVSALGETPTEDNRVSARGIRPYRVTNPVLWLLAQFGTIPVK